jgi:hypothetical protein
MSNLKIFDHNPSGEMFLAGEVDVTEPANLYFEINQTSQVYLYSHGDHPEPEHISVPLKMEEVDDKPQWAKLQPHPIDELLAICRVVQTLRHNGAVSPGHDIRVKYRGYTVSHAEISESDEGVWIFAPPVKAEAAYCNYRAIDKRRALTYLLTHMDQHNLWLYDEADKLFTEQLSISWDEMWAPPLDLKTIKDLEQAFLPQITDDNGTADTIEYECDCTNRPGWFDLGWVKNFKFTPESKNMSLAQIEVLQREKLRQTLEDFDIGYNRSSAGAFTEVTQPSGEGTPECNKLPRISF